MLEDHARWAGQFAVRAPHTHITVVHAATWGLGLGLGRPGNGNGDVHGSNWYSEAHDALQKFCTKRCVGHRVDVVLENMPDAHKAREKIWVSQP